MVVKKHTIYLYILSVRIDKQNMYNTIHKTYNTLKDILYKTDTRKYISTCHKLQI